MVSYPPAMMRSASPLWSIVTASAMLPRLDEQAEHVVAAGPSKFKFEIADFSVLPARKSLSSPRSPLRIMRMKIARQLRRLPAVFFRRKRRLHRAHRPDPALAGGDVLPRRVARKSQRGDESHASDDDLFAAGLHD